MKNHDNALSTLPEKASKKTMQRIGPLQANCQLTLQSQAAQQLLFGLPKGSHSLFLFARKLNYVWHCARHDNPYADQTLLAIYETMQTLEVQLLKAIEPFKKEQKKDPALLLTDVASVKPMTHALYFRTPYAFFGARLLALFDTFVCYSIGGEFLGLTNGATSAQDVIWQWKRKLRRLFAMPERCMRIDITRQDIIDNNETYQTIKATFGEVSLDILNKTLRPPHAPWIVISRHAKKSENNAKKAASDNEDEKAAKEELQTTAQEDATDNENEEKETTIK